MKVLVDSERCQGHTLCSMIAPDSFELSDIDGTSSPVNEVVPADQEDAVAKPCTRARNRPSRSKSETARKRRETSLEHVDDIAKAAADSDRKKNRYHFDRHTPEYRLQFEKITEEMQSKCPMAWTDTYDGHWVAAGQQGGLRAGPLPGGVQRPRHQRRDAGYQGITIPKAQRATVVRGGILEMDEPEHSTYRGALNPYLSPAAVKRWQPFVDEIIRAASTRRSSPAASTSSTTSPTSCRRCSRWR